MASTEKIHRDDSLKTKHRALPAASPESEQLRGRQADPGPGAQPANRKPSARTAGELLGYQPIIGNRAVGRLLSPEGSDQQALPEFADSAEAHARLTGQAQEQIESPNVLQRWIPFFGWGGAATNDQGGAADATNLEQDMRDIIMEWKEAANDGVNLFATTELSRRLDDLESGSWKTFIFSLVGNTIWALAAFTPVGASAAAFRISMSGIAVAALPTIPSQSKSQLPEVQKKMQDYIYSVYDQINKDLRTVASRATGENKDITRYHALAEFVKANFKPDYYTIDPSYNAIPALRKDAIRDKYEQVAADILSNYTDIGQVYPSEYRYNEVAYIQADGQKRMALIEVDDFCPSCPPDFKKWISTEAESDAIARWNYLTNNQREVRTLNATDVSGIPTK